MIDKYRTETQGDYWFNSPFKEQVAAALRDQFEERWKAVSPLNKPSPADRKRVHDQGNRLRTSLQDSPEEYVRSEKDGKLYHAPTWLDKTNTLYRSTNGKNREAIVYAMAGIVDQAARNIPQAFEAARRVIEFASALDISDISGHVRNLEQSKIGQDPEMAPYINNFKDYRFARELDHTQGQVIYQNLKAKPPTQE